MNDLWFSEALQYPNDKWKFYLKAQITILPEAHPEENDWDKDPYVGNTASLHEPFTVSCLFQEVGTATEKIIVHVQWKAIKNWTFIFIISKATEVAEKLETRMIRSETIGSIALLSTMPIGFWQMMKRTEKAHLHSWSFCTNFTRKTRFLPVWLNWNARLNSMKRPNDLAQFFNDCIRTCCTKMKDHRGGHSIYQIL